MLVSRFHAHHGMSETSCLLMLSLLGNPCCERFALSLHAGPKGSCRAAELHGMQIAEFVGESRAQRGKAYIGPQTSCIWTSCQVGGHHVRRHGIIGHVQAAAAAVGLLALESCCITHLKRFMSCCRCCYCCCCQPFRGKRAIIGQVQACEAADVAAGAAANQSAVSLSWLVPDQRAFAGAVQHQRPWNGQ